MATTLVSATQSPNRSLVRVLILRLTLPLGIVSLAMMVLLGVLTEQRERRVIGDSLTRAAARITAALDANLGERAADVAMLVALNKEWLGRDPDTARRVYDQLLARQPAFAWVGNLDAEGRILAASGGVLQGQSGASRPVFQEGRKGLFIGDVHDAVLLAQLLPAPPNGEPLRFIDIAQPIPDDAGGPPGVLATHLSWTWVRQLFGQLLPEFDRRRGLEMLILSHDNKVLAGPPDSEGRVLALQALQGTAAATPGSMQWAQDVWPGGTDYVFAFADSRLYGVLGRLGWRVMVRQPSELALAPVRQLRAQLAAIALMLTLGLALLAWVLARRVTRPLADIADAAEGIARGEPAVIPRGSRLKEVEGLALALQHMIDTLTHRERALDHMHTLAHRDPLTGLHNRRALDLHMDMAVQRSGRTGERFAVLALDLDGFKPVNDTHGHDCGDALLRQVAERLSEVVRSSEMLARLGGDEFVILISGEPAHLEYDARIVATRVQACFTADFTPAGQQVRIGCSIGIALGLQPQDTPRSLLPRADRALYAAKRGGRGRVAWDGLASAA